MDTALLIFAVVLLAAFLLSARDWWEQKSWKRPVPGYFYGTEFSVPKGYPPRRLTHALQMAETCLIRHGKRWNAGQLGAVCMCLRIQVVKDPSESIVSLRRGSLPGRGHIVLVGPRLDTLAHELAHLCEAVLDGTVDESHTQWDRDGLWQAVRVYEEWVSKQHWETT